MDISTLSLHFFHWLCSFNGFLPDHLSLNALFDALMEAKAYNAAKSFIDYTGFKPDSVSLELYIQCLCQGGLDEEVFDVFDRLRGVGVCPSIATWNSALLGGLILFGNCIKRRWNPMLWQKLMLRLLGILFELFVKITKFQKVMNFFARFWKTG